MFSARGPFFLARGLDSVLTYNHSLQPTILNDNVNQFKVGLESDKGYFTKKVGHQISVSFEKFDVVQALFSFCL
jgi:hypothetical protein